MNWLVLHTIAQVSVERILNAIPEGFLIALFAWALLSVLRRQNSGTRFAVWFLALLTVAVLPVLSGFGAGRVGISSGTSWASAQPAIVIPESWALFVFLVWAMGASVALLRLAAGFWRLRRLRRDCTVIAAADLDPAVRKTVAAIVASNPVAAKSITIATSECVRVPSAIGFWNPTIILPGWAVRELPAADLNVILLHEFAHLRRGDDWTNLVQKIVGALFFFHPAVWWIDKRLSVEREMACDDAVLAETANPRGYAACLVSLLEKSLAQRRWSMVQAAVHRAREASLRLAQILDTERPKATRVWTPALALAGAFSVVCLLALTHAPQIVAFDSGVSASKLEAARPAQQPLPSISGAPAVAVNLQASTALRADGRDARRSMVPRVRPRRVSAVAARLSEMPSRPRIAAVSARTDTQAVPQFQTLVLVETTQYVISDSAVWRVQVWRVTLLNSGREPLASAPVPHSI
jgi:beta-lactamase regulating signal transducer with metallopeptidase domain